MSTEMYCRLDGISDRIDVLPPGSRTHRSSTKPARISVSSVERAANGLLNGFPPTAGVLARFSPAPNAGRL